MPSSSAPPPPPPSSELHIHTIDTDDDEPPFLVTKRIAILGARGVGKSALSIRCAHNKFESDYRLTFQDMYTWKPVVNGVHYDVSIDDTDGQDENSEFGMRYTTGIDGYVLVFSVRDPSSFQVIKAINEKLLDTLMVLDRKGVREVPRVLVGNQVDIVDERQVRTQLANAYAKDQGIPYLETSAYTAQNAQAIFEKVLEIIQQNLYDSHMDLPIAPVPVPTDKQLPPVQPQSPPSTSCLVQ